MKLYHATLAALVLAVGANAQAFIQCSEGGILLDILDTLAGTVGTLITGITSSAACTSSCEAQLIWSYSYFTSGTLGIAEACYCTSFLQPPSAADVDSASSSSGTCSSSDFVSVELSTNGFAFVQCYASVTLSGGGSSFTVSDPSTCFSDCASYTYASLEPVATSFLGITSGSYTCQCGITETTGSAAVCGNNVPILYKRTTASAARRKRDILEQARQKKRNGAIAYCPSGLTACNVPATTGTKSYECIDTTAELESCGGCTYGSFSASNDTMAATIGEDCTRIQGASRGAVTCDKGQCKVFGCRPNFELVSGRCIPRAASSEQQLILQQ